MKKLFIISSVLLVIVLVFLGINKVAFNKNSNNSGSSSLEKDENTASSGLFGFGNDKEKDRIFSLSEEAVIAPTLDSEENEVIYFTASDGKIKGVSILNLNSYDLGENVIGGLVDAVWSPSKREAILERDKDNKKVFQFNDYDKKTSEEIKKEVDNIVWNDMGNKIIYKYFDEKTKERTLNISDPSGTNWKKIADIEYRNINIAPIPKNSLISYWNYPSAFQETSLKAVSALGGGSDEIFSGKYGADYKWSPNGERILISSLKDRQNSKITLGIIDKSSKEYNDLGIPTIASKCVWSKNSDAIYYAFPSSIPENITMPDDYQSGKIVTKDTFWKVDVTTGEKSRIIELDDLEKVNKVFDATNLFLSPEEDTLFFVNKIDGRLYGIQVRDF